MEKRIFKLLLLVFFIFLSIRIYIAYYYAEGQGEKWEISGTTTSGLPIMFAKFSFCHQGFRDRYCSDNIMLYGVDNKECINSGGGSSYGKEILPNYCEILYYSFKEKKFYEDKINLDYDKVQSIAKEVVEDIENKYCSNVFKVINFKVRVYPKGKVEVLIGGGKETPVKEIKVNTFFLKSKKYDWSVFYKDYQSSGGFGESKSVSIQHSLLMNKYKWIAQVVLPEDTLYQELYVYRYGNRDEEINEIKDYKHFTYEGFVSLPKELSLQWKTQKSFFSTNFKFDELKIIEYFNLASDNGKLPLILQIFVFNDSKKVKVILKGKYKTFDLIDSDESNVINVN